MDRDTDRDKGKADCRWASSECSASSTTAEAFDFASDLAAHSRNSWDRSSGSNRPSTGCFADRTSHSSRAAVSWAVESLGGLRRGDERESCDH